MKQQGKTIPAQLQQKHEKTTYHYNAQSQSLHRQRPTERIRNFLILERDLSIEADEVTPTMKVKRNVVAARYKELLEKLYA